MLSSSQRDPAEVQVVWNSSTQVIGPELILQIPNVPHRPPESHSRSTGTGTALHIKANEEEEEEARYL
ncbi:hypothetical protein EYF80_056330 [Liparis tanakae]|uniref:Uncharacterized protein n=1 Tax=Liparis tanakae TaxID=230148 RepID=A0A4Z2EXF8_9TELE|nr:hypothetical protein EYF80_056330 [Liparis tanakae]